MRSYFGQAISWTGQVRTQTLSWFKPDQYPPVGFDPRPSPVKNLTTPGYSPTKITSHDLHDLYLMLKNIGQAISWLSQVKTPTRSGIKPDRRVLVRYLRGPGPVDNLSKPGFSLTNRTKKRFFLIRKFHGLNTWSKNLPS